MFDISEKLIVEQSDEICAVPQISWEDSSWKDLSLVSDEEVSTLSHAKDYVFTDSALCLWEGESEPNIKYCVGRTSWCGSKVHHNTELWTQLTENRCTSSGIFSKDHHIAAHQQRPWVHDQNVRSITIQRTTYLHVDFQWHHMGSEDNETECIAN